MKYPFPIHLLSLTNKKILIILTRRISIINFKGGVGKTTVIFHIATGLARFHKSKVLLVDVDHQSSLSLVCLSEKQWEEAIRDGRTVNSIFLHYTTPGTPIPDENIVLRSPMRNYPSLDILPAELQLDETELDLSESASGGAIVSEWEKRMLIAKWLEENNIDEEYDYILFDCPPATKIVTQNAIAISHGYFIPTIPDSVSIRGIPHLIDRMFVKIDEKFAGLAKYLKSSGKEIIDSYISTTNFLGIIIFRIRTHGPAYSGYVDDHTIHLRQLEARYPNDIIEPYIEEGVGVTESLAARLPVYDCSYNYNVRNRNYIEVFKELTNEVKDRIDNL